MASANPKLSSSLYEDINTLSLFGKFQPGDLTFSAHEEEERNRRFIQAQIERERELKRQEKKRKEEEIAYQDFLNGVKGQESRRRNEISYYIPPPMARGRGSLLMGAVSGGIRETKPRGRGRLSPHEKECLPLFDRAQKVQKNLQQFSDSSLHNNAVQKFYWNGMGTNKDEEENEHYTADCYTIYTDSSSTSDQYEDAECSSHTSSPQSFNSIPSRPSSSAMSTASPALEPPASINISPPRPEAAPFSPRPRKPRGNRLAAKFSNNVEEEEDVKKETASNKFEQKYTLEEEAVGAASGIEEDREDMLAVLGSSRAPIHPFNFRTGLRSGGTSFNSLHPSQRVLSNNVLRPEELYYSNAGSSDEFTLNMNDFPAL